MSDCGCVYSSGGDCDEPAFATVATVTARKPHKCCECGETILAGAKYQRVSGKWDGRVDSFATCLSCSEIRGLLFCEGWIYGAMWEDIHDYFREGGRITGCFEQLETAAAKQKLADAFRDFKGLSA